MVPSRNGLGFEKVSFLCILLIISNCTHVKADQPFCNLTLNLNGLSDNYETFKDNLEKMYRVTPTDIKNPIAIFKNNIISAFGIQDWTKLDELEQDCSNIKGNLLRPTNLYDFDLLRELMPKIAMVFAIENRKNGLYINHFKLVTTKNTITNPTHIYVYSKDSSLSLSYMKKDDPPAKPAGITTFALVCSSPIDLNSFESLQIDNLKLQLNSLKIEYKNALRNLFDKHAKQLSFDNDKIKEQKTSGNNNCIQVAIGNTKIDTNIKTYTFMTKQNEREVIEQFSAVVQNIQKAVASIKNLTNTDWQNYELSVKQKSVLEFLQNIDVDQVSGQAVIMITTLFSIAIILGFICVGICTCCIRRTISNFANNLTR